MLQISLAISRQLPRQINLVSQNSNGDELHSASTSSVCAFFSIKQMAYAIKYGLVSYDYLLVTYISYHIHQ